MRRDKRNGGPLAAGYNSRDEIPAAATYTVNTYPYTLRYGLRDCVAHLADLGFRSFEPMLVPGHFWPSREAAGEQQRIASLLASRDLRIVTLNQPNLDINLGSTVPEMREHSCAMMIAAMRLAGDWGAMGIVINPGKANPVLPAPREQLADCFRRSLDALMPEAERWNVQLIVKNHPLSYLHRAADFVSFFDGYGWERIGIGYDFANGYFGREDPREALQLLNSRIKLIYAADSGLDEFRHDPVGAGAVGFNDIAETLRSLGYRGDTVLEILADDADHALAASVAHLESRAWPRQDGQKKEHRYMATAAHYPGPLSLANAKTKLIISQLKEDVFHREGPRANVEYRDLGLAAATGGRIGAKHIRAIKPFETETGWHWHDMTGHFVYVLKGWLKFRFDGVPDEIIVEAGSCISQPAGVPHNVIGQSDDLEVIEINLPAEFSTIELTRTRA